MQIGNNRVWKFSKFNFCALLRISLSVLVALFLSYILDLVFPTIIKSAEARIWLNIAIIEVTIIVYFILFVVLKLGTMLYIDYFLPFVIMPLKDIIELLSWFNQTYVFVLALTLFGTVAIVVAHTLIFFGLLMLVSISKFQKY